jgi:hypothetical protein
LPKLTLVVLEFRERAGATTLPLAGIISVPPGASVVREIEPLALPLAAAVKVTLNVLLAPAAIVSGSFNPVVPNPVPVTTTLEIVAVAFPLLVNAMVCELFEPIATFGKLALAGLAESCACGVGVGVGVPGDCGTLEVTKPAHPLVQLEAARTIITMSTAAMLVSWRRSPRVKSHLVVPTPDLRTGMLRSF